MPKAHRTPPPPTRRPSRPRTMSLTHESRCFDSLEWVANGRSDSGNGVVTAEFRKGGTYQYDISRADMKEFLSDPSAGSWFNLFLRD